MRRLMKWTWIALMLALVAGCSVVALSGCRSPQNSEPPPKMQAELEQKAREFPGLWKLLGGIVTLAKDKLEDLGRYVEKLNRRQELQAMVRHRLIVGAVACGLFAVLGGAGKLLEGGALAAAWYGALLVWIARQVRWRSLAAAGLACACCVCLSIWLVPLWRLACDLAWLVGAVALFFAGWEFSCRFYTGAWTPDGLVRLPKGWQTKPEAKR